MNNLLNLSVAILVGFYISGCMSVAEFSGYDSQTLNASAANQYAELISKAQSENIIDTSSNTAKQVYRVFNRLLPYARQEETSTNPMQWEIKVIKSEEMNAWAMPGGKMAVYTGLVEKLNLTDAELAAVIGHEMVHALHEHSKEQAGQKVLTSLGLQYGGAILAQHSNISPDAINIGSSLLDEYGISKPFSRHHENDADVGGLFLMAKAGYNPHNAIEVWQKMSAASGRGAKLEFMSTHPSDQSRIASLQALMPQAMEVYQQSVLH